MDTRHAGTMGGTVATRRGFLAAGAAAGAAGAMAGASLAAADEAGLSFDETTDVLVLGGGAGGCYAARYAMEQGARVILVEACSKLGGTALLSGGGFHTWDITPDNVDEALAHSEPSRRRQFIETWQSVYDWTVNESGVEVLPISMENPLYGSSIVGFMIGGLDGAAGRQKFFEDLVAGAVVETSTYFEDLIEVDGTVVGAVVRGADGASRRIGATSVVIATGSFQANKGMIERHVGRYADCAICRATPYNTGRGVVSALDHGARLSKGTGRFYGHMNPWPALTPTTEAEFEQADLNAASAIMGVIQKFSIEGIAVNMNGKRFTDEGPEKYVGDNYLANETLQQPDGHVFVVIDSAEDHADGLEAIRQAGGLVVSAETVDELAEQLAAYRVNPCNLRKTIAEYQQAAAEGTTLELDVPKSPMQTGYLTKLDTPPFFAVRASAGISGFYGGIEISDAGEVLGHGQNPIPGLYAAPMAAGGIFYKEYGGGLAMCATFGSIAGTSAGKKALGL